MFFYKLFFRLSPIFKYKIIGSSMSPTFDAGDIVLVNRLTYWLSPPEIGDVVAIHDPRNGRVLIKRITSIEGQRYFVQGDNKKYSTDSRVFGMIGRLDILGKVIDYVS